MRALRFLHLTTFYPPHNFGGDGIGVQRLCRALARRGHHVRVVYDRDAYRRLSGGRDPAVGPDPDGVEITPLSSSMGALSLVLTHQLGSPVAHGPAIRKIIDEGKYDVVNFHNISLMGGPGLLSYGGDALKLYMAHEHWLVCPSHVLWRHNRELCTGRECLRCVLNYHRPPQLWRYSGALRRHGRGVDSYIALSEFSRQKHKEYGFPFPMEVLPLSLPDPGPVVEGDDSGQVHPRPYFLFVGRLEKLKGLQEVIPLFSRHEEADLLIAGEGSYLQPLKDLAGNNPRVKFLGRIPPEKLESVYRQALALIVPSLCYETFGLILIEAFRYRTPVLARNIGPLPEVVNRARAGLLFDTPDQLASAMRDLQANPARRESLAANGHEAFLAEYAESRVIPRYLEIIRRAAARKGDGEILGAMTGGVQ